LTSPVGLGDGDLLFHTVWGWGVRWVGGERWVGNGVGFRGKGDGLGEGEGFGGGGRWVWGREMGLETEMGWGVRWVRDGDGFRREMGFGDEDGLGETGLGRETG